MSVPSRRDHGEGLWKVPRPVSITSVRFAAVGGDEVVDVADPSRLLGVSIRVTSGAAEGFELRCIAVSGDVVLPFGVFLPRLPDPLEGLQSGETVELDNRYSSRSVTCRVTTSMTRTLRTCVSSRSRACLSIRRPLQWRLRPG